MTGLLYKDFIAIKGKVYVIASFLFLLFISTLRIVALFVDEKDAEAFDVIAVPLLLKYLVVAFCVLIGNVGTAMLKADDGKKQKQYYLSLPVEKKGYVAEKYVFLLLAYYFVISVAVLGITVCKAGMVSASGIKLASALDSFNSMLPMLVSLLLVVSSIELPFFIGFGTKKGYAVKIGLLMVLFFAVMVYLLFGDLNVFSGISFISVMEYMKKHPTLIAGLQIVMPLVSGILYFISYRISCILFARKEWEDD